jgi:deoxycytidine triphosphate deaminase
VIRNANYVWDLIIDPTNRAKKAQVGVDLTLNKVSKIGAYYPFSLMTMRQAPSDWWSSAGIILSDEKATGSLRHAKVAEYKVVEPVAEADGYSTFTAWNLEPGVYSVEFEQGLKPLPKDNTAMIINRSSVGRSGAMIRSSIYDPNFSTDKMGALLYIFTPIIIEQYARVAQIIIMENEDVAFEDLYRGQYSGGKDFR